MEEELRLYVNPPSAHETGSPFPRSSPLALSPRRFYAFYSVKPLRGGLLRGRLFAGSGLVIQGEFSHATQTYDSHRARHSGGELRWPNRLRRGIGGAPRHG